MDKEMGLLEHLDEFRRRLLFILGTVGVLMVFCFTFGIRYVTVAGRPFFYPYPDVYENLSILFLRRLQHDLLPNYVKLIVTAPAQAFLALIYVSLFLGAVFSMPMTVYQVAKFVNPALRPMERGLILRITLPSMALFISGALFSYIVMIPFVLDFLFTYGVALDVATFLTLDGFISFVLQFILAFGLAFQLPILMVLLTSIGVVGSITWKRNQRYAIFGALVFGAFITPDGSGVTMFMVAGPMILLYLIGCLVASRGKPEKGR